MPKHLAALKRVLRFQALSYGRKAKWMIGAFQRHERIQPIDLR